MKKEFRRYKQLIERSGDREQKRKNHSQIIGEFYDENIIQIENCEKPIKGKEKLYGIENKNLDGVNSLVTKVNEVVFDNDTGSVWGQMIINFDSKKNGKKRLEEAFIQKWLNGKIIYQRFYYGQMINEEAIS